MKSRSLDWANTCYTTVRAGPCRLLLISLIPIFSPIPATCLFKINMAIHHPGVIDELWRSSSVAQ